MRRAIGQVSAASESTGHGPVGPDPRQHQLVPVSDEVAERVGIRGIVVPGSVEALDPSRGSPNRKTQLGDNAVIGQPADLVPTQIADIGRSVLEQMGEDDRAALGTESHQQLSVLQGQDNQVAITDIRLDLIEQIVEPQPADQTHVDRVESEAPL